MRFVVQLRPFEGVVVWWEGGAVACVERAGYCRIHRVSIDTSHV